MYTVCFFSLKGGTGKTTLCTNLGWLLAENGYTVLLIDLDPQGHMTQSIQPVSDRGSVTLIEVLTADRPLVKAVVNTPYARLFIVPANEEHLTLDTALIDQPWREWKLKDALTAMGPHPCDWVLIDVGANINLITYNALFSARTLIAPALPDVYSYLSLKTLFHFLGRTGRHYQYAFDRVWVLINRLNPHRPQDRKSREALKRYYARYLFPVMVREDPKITQAVQAQVPLPIFAPQAPAVRDMRRVTALWEEVFPRTTG